MRTCVRALPAGQISIMSELFHELRRGFQSMTFNLRFFSLLTVVASVLTITDWHYINGITHWLPPQANLGGEVHY